MLFPGRAARIFHTVVVVLLLPPVSPVNNFLVQLQKAFFCCSALHRSNTVVFSLLHTSLCCQNNFPRAFFAHFSNANISCILDPQFHHVISPTLLPITPGDP